MFNFFAIFKDKKKVDHILESSLDSTSFFDALNVIYQLSKLKDDIHVVSQFSCLLRHPVRTTTQLHNVVFQEEKSPKVQ